MFQTRNTYIKSHMKMADLIIENPSLLLLMEYFNIAIVVRNKSIEQICIENKISQTVFIAIANLYNGFHYPDNKIFNESHVDDFLLFLKNSHKYYKQEKYPEIKSLIDQLYRQNQSPEMKLVEKFFDEYFEEVLEHLDYEEKIVFPYIFGLTGNLKIPEHKKNRKYNVSMFDKEHTDIEYKLSELKSLLLKHIDLNDDHVLRRKLILSLFEVEHDLKIHAGVEDNILIPLIKKIEDKKL